MRLIKNDKRGDTIIEVLISLAVLGFILTVAYTITNRALGTIRASQERVEALKIAESHIEALNSYAHSSNTTTVDSVFPSSSNPFCVSKLDGSIVNFTQSPPSDAQSDTFSSSVYPAGCLNQPLPNGIYNVFVQPPGDTNGGVYTVFVRWDRYGSTLNDEVKLESKLFRPVP